MTWAGWGCKPPDMGPVLALVVTLGAHGFAQLLTRDTVLGL